MPPRDANTPEEFELTNLMEEVERTLGTLLNGNAEAKQPWTFALVAMRQTDGVFAFLSSDKEPQKAAAMFMIAADRIMTIDPEDIAEVQRRAKQRKPN